MVGMLVRERKDALMGVDELVTEEVRGVRKYFRTVRVWVRMYVTYFRTYVLPYEVT